MSKHTYGEWIMEWDMESKSHNIIISSGVKEVCEVFGDDYPAMPDAKLIRAAPEMLHELKVARDMYEHYNETERARRVDALVSEIESE